MPVFALCLNCTFQFSPSLPGSMPAFLWAPHGLSQIPAHREASMEATLSALEEVHVEMGRQADITRVIE